MNYKTIAQIVHMSRSTLQPSQIAQEEYQRRIESYATFTSGIELNKHECFVVNCTDIALLHDAIQTQEVRVRSLWESLPPMARYAYLHELILTEMMSTNEIEGVRSTRQEISEALEDAKEESSHKRFVEFARIVLALAYSTDEHPVVLPESIEDIHSVYEQVTQGELNPEDVLEGTLYRQSDVVISNRATGATIHRGIASKNITYALSQWFQLIHNESIPSLIRICMSHFLFEYIHPFYDGNGRTGRVLLAMQLSQFLTMPTTLSLSSVIEREKSAYYKAFEETENPLNCMDCTMFVYRMLDFIHQAQSNVLDECELKLELLQEAQSVLRELCDERQYSETKYALLDAMIQEYLFGNNRSVTRKRLQVGLHIGARKIKELEDLVADGTLDTHGQRPKYYSLSERTRTLVLHDE